MDFKVFSFIYIVKKPKADKIVITIANPKSPTAKAITGTRIKNKIWFDPSSSVTKLL